MLHYEDLNGGLKTLKVRAARLLSDALSQRGNKSESGDTGLDVDTREGSAAAHYILYPEHGIAQKCRMHIQVSGFK